MNCQTRVDGIENQVRGIDVHNRRITFLAQSAALGSDDWLILPYAGKAGWKDFQHNPVFVASHIMRGEAGQPTVIGSVKSASWSDEGMEQTVEFAQTPLAEDYWTLYRDGHMRAVSISWELPDEREEDGKRMDALLNKYGIELKPEERGRLRAVVKGYRQLELSAVAVGADPRALVHAAEAGNMAARSICRDAGIVVESDPAPEAIPEPVPEPVPARETSDTDIIASALRDVISAGLQEQTRLIVNELRELIAERSKPEPEPVADGAGAPEPADAGRKLYDEILGAFRRPQERQRVEELARLAAETKNAMKGNRK